MTDISYVRLQLLVVIQAGYVRHSRAGVNPSAYQAFSDIVDSRLRGNDEKK